LHIEKEHYLSHSFLNISDLSDLGKSLILFDVVSSNTSLDVSDD